MLYSDKVISHDQQVVRSNTFSSWGYYFLIHLTINLKMHLETKIFSLKI